MRPLALALLLSACVPEMSQSTRPAERIGPVIEKFEDKEVFWALYNGRLMRCAYDAGKGAPVCMIPPIIKVPAELWTPYLGVPATGRRKGAESPVVE